MAKYLMVNSDTDFPQDWRLPEPVDESELQNALQWAMREGEVIEVEVEVGEGADIRRSTLLLHGAKIATAVVVELVKPPTAFRLLGS
ncbi:MAG: hypothetical protein ACR2L3_04200 [Actinomycetota bacterium]